MTNLTDRPIEKGWLVKFVLYPKISHGRTCAKFSTAVRLASIINCNIIVSNRLTLVDCVESKFALFHRKDKSPITQDRAGATAVTTTIYCCRHLPYSVLIKVYRARLFIYRIWNNLYMQTARCCYSWTYFDVMHSHCFPQRWHLFHCIFCSILLWILVYFRRCKSLAGVNIVSNWSMYIE